MSDLGERADDYEVRLSKAGSTEDLVIGLVKTVDRSKRTLRLIIISLVVDVVLSIGMMGITLVAWTNADNIEKNTNRFKGVVYEQCMDAQVSAKSVNAVLTALIENAAVSTIFSPAEKSARMKNYEKARVNVHSCAKL